MDRGRSLTARTRGLRLMAAMALAFVVVVPVNAGQSIQSAAAATCASANVGITALHNPIFYSDFSPSPPSLPNLAGHYAGYRVTNNTGAPVNGAWIKLSGFTGGVVSLATGQADSQPLDDLATSASGLGYFYLQASATTAAAQTHTISVYDRQPTLAGAVELCNTTFSYTAVTGTTQAAANKVNVATATSNPPGLGAIMTMTVSGDTGTIGAGPASDPKGFDMTPASVVSGASAWTPGAFRLVSASLNINLTGAGAATYSDLLHYTITDPSSADRPYTATYEFLIVGTTSASTAMTPIQFIASGTQIKHTSMSDASYTAILPIQPISNTTTLAKSVSPRVLTVPGGTVTFSVTATNTSGSQSAALDDFTDTPGAGSTYVPGTSTFDGSAIADPLSSGGTLVWPGSWAIPAGTSRALTYQMSISTGLGTVTNSVIGHVGSTVIDTTVTTGDNSPATSSVRVAEAPTLTLLKSIGSRIAAADQFTVAIMNGATTVASATTTGAGSSATTGSQTLVSGTPYTLTDAMAGGSTSTIAQYEGAIGCSNTNGGSSTVLPSGSGTSFAITPEAGDVITCTITNTPQPRLTLLKSVASRADSSDQFTVAIQDGPTTVASATTTGAGTSATTNVQSLTTGTTYTLTDSMAAGSASVLGQYASSISCTNTAGGSSTVLPSGTGTSFSITPTISDVITCTITNTAGTASLGLTKTAAPTTDVDAGDVIDYSFTATNTGNLPLTAVTVSDPLVGLSTVSCTPSQGSALAAGATMTCSATYPVTQDDVDAGSIINTASVDAIDPSGNPVVATDGSTVLTAADASFSLSKAASPSTNVVAGDTVTYTFSGQNTGKVTLHDVTVTDPMPGLSAISCTPSTPATLARNATISCTADYTVTQANVDAGSFPNTATISGLTPPNVPVSKTASRTVTALQTATLGLTKSASPEINVVAGDVVTYTLSGQNLGTVTVHAVTVTDPMPGLGPITCTPSAPATLAPAATISCTASYTVTQTDVDAGSFSNTATISGLDPTNTPIQATGSETVTANQTANVSFTKDATPDFGVVAGDAVAYSFDATNNGTVTLHAVTVTDPMPGLGTITCTPAAPATLAPGASISCTADYTVTQTNVDAGFFTNTATFDSLDPNDAPETHVALKTVNADQTADLTFSKSASPNTNVSTGQLVTYTLDGENTGQVTLHDVTVTDPMPGLGPITCTPVAPATLAPGATISCTADYTVTQTDVDAGSIVNTATIDGLDPTNNPVTDTATATVTTDAAASFSFTKTAAPDTDVVAGDVVIYTFDATNTGAVAVHNVTVTDPMPGLSAITCTPAAPATLAPAATISCTATYTVTQADVDAGSIVNTATIDGLDPTNSPVDQTAGETVTAATAASFSLTKTASPNTGVVAGDVVTYTIAGTNTGAVTVHDVNVTDPMPGLSAITCTPAAPATLAPAATISCTATYTVTQANVNAGSFTNTATINGLDPTDNPVTDTATATVTASTAASLSLTKTASPNTGVVAGDTVTYTITGTNNGAVTVHDVNVTDPMPGLSAISCTPTAPATLASGNTITCTATYTVTQADVDAGTISNTANIDGLDPTDSPVTDTATATVTADDLESVDFTKVASPTSGVATGDEITYIMTATNTGSVTIFGATITDAKPGLSQLDCTPAQGADLAPGASMTCTATYSVTQADMTAGEVTNSAAVSGDDGAGNPISQVAGAIVPTRTSADVTLTKKLAGVAGSVATWEIAVMNTGTTVYPGPITVTDQLPTGLKLDSAIGNEWVCTGTGTVTCVHASDLAVGSSSTVTVRTTITGSGDITNVATMDIAGEAVLATAAYRPAAGFAMTGAEASRLGLVGLLALVGGWMFVAATRRNDRDEHEALSKQ